MRKNVRNLYLRALQPGVTVIAPPPYDTGQPVSKAKANKDDGQRPLPVGRIQIAAACCYPPAISSFTVSQSNWALMAV